MTTDTELLEAVVATEIERMRYLTDLATRRDTAGPAVAPPAAPTSHADHPNFVDGFWVGATRVDAHPGRIGGHIDPEVAVDHSTDMHPDDWEALKLAWLSKAGDGACATFLVGPTEVQGTLQLVSILRNANHVGGKTPPSGHGWFVDSAHPGVTIHPNLLAVGIEFMCAGGMVRRVNGAWRFVENGQIHGRAFTEDEIEPDPIRPGRGWHKLTPYQERVRSRLHLDLDAVMRPMRPGLRAVSTGEAVPNWGVSRSTRFLGHVTLDPTNRSDPWPNGMRALR